MSTHTLLPTAGARGSRTWSSSEGPGGERRRDPRGPVGGIGKCCPTVTCGAVEDRAPGVSVGVSLLTAAHWGVYRICRAAPRSAALPRAEPDADAGGCPTMEGAHSEGAQSGVLRCH